MGYSPLEDSRFELGVAVMGFVEHFGLSFQIVSQLPLINKAEPRETETTNERHRTILR